MANLQSEIIFIAKLGGIIFAAYTYYSRVIKTMAIFNERQKQNKHDIEDLKKFKDDFLTLKAEHDLKSCRRKK